MDSEHFDSNQMDHSIGDLAAKFVDLHQRAISVYQPIVDEVIEKQSVDVQHIERTLDGLLGFADTDAGLSLFKKLCKHYWHLDAVAAALYVGYYREMWDN